MSPRVEWRGLNWRRKLHTQKGYILYLQMSVDLTGISGDNLSSRIFWRNYKFQNKVTCIILRKTHALLRPANAVSPLHSTCGYGVATMSRLLKVHHELCDVTNSPLLSRFVAPSKCCEPSPLHWWSAVLCLVLYCVLLYGVECSSSVYCSLVLVLQCVCVWCSVV